MQFDLIHFFWLVCLPTRAPTMTMMTMMSRIGNACAEMSVICRPQPLNGLAVMDDAQAGAEAEAETNELHLNALAGRPSSHTPPSCFAGRNSLDLSESGFMLALSRQVGSLLLLL